MARVAPINTTFNAGELSPLMTGRVDLAKYANGCELLENAIPMITGPAAKRPGTRFVREAANSANKSRLLPFEFSTTQAFALEFGNTVIRFFANGGIVLDGGTPYSIASPYTSAELPLINFAQSADVVYLVHPNHAPRKLARFGPTNWTLTEVVFDRPPFQDLNVTETTLTASALTGAITVTSSANLFAASDVGKIFSLGVIPAAQYDAWVIEEDYTAGQIIQSQGRVYEAMNSGESGTLPPLHTKGTESDGGVSWKYLGDGTGYFRVTSYTSPTSVQATVVQDLPIITATTRWARGSWSVDDGYPRTVTFYEDRLWLGGSKAQPQTLWASVVGDYENFTSGSNDDDGLNYTINTQDLNTITWLSPGKVLAIGTTSGEFTISGNQISDPITASSVRILPQTTYGCTGAVRPLRVASSILFLQRAGRKVREYTYNFETDSYVAPNLNSLADHITESGLVDMTYQQEPSQVVWAPRADGVLVGLTYERAEDVVGWNRHTLGGTVESVVALPHWDGDQDVLWLIVRREVDGVQRRYVEYMEKRLTGAQAFYVDSGLTYQGSPVTGLSGLEHLEGKEVAVLTDGAVHPSRTVVDGAIALQRPAGTVVVGLPYTMRVRPMRYDAGAQNGTSQGKTQRINGVVIRLYETGSGLWYGSPTSMDELNLRSSLDAMDEPIPLFTGDTPPMPWPEGYEGGARVQIEHRLPLPCTIVALMPQLTTYDR